MSYRQIAANAGAVFSSAAIAKVLGLIRELLVAYIFGATHHLAVYIALRSTMDSFLVLAGGSAFQGSVVPRIAHMVRAGKFPDFRKLRATGVRIGLTISVLGLVIALMGIETKLGPLAYLSRLDSYLLVVVLIACSILIVSSSVGLMGLQGLGEFKRYSIISGLNPFIATIILFPLSLLGVLGIALSRLGGAAAQEILTWRRIKILEVRHRNTTVESIDEHQLIKPWEILAWSLPSAVLLLGRLFVGYSTETDIVYFNYAVVLLFSVVSLASFTTSGVILQGQFILGNKKWITILSFIFVSIYIGIYLIISSYIGDIVSFIIARGSFTEADAALTSDVIHRLVPPFGILLFGSLFYQYAFSVSRSNRQRFARIVVILAFLIPFILFLLLTMSQDMNTTDVISGTTIGVLYLYVCFTIYTAVGIIWFIGSETEQ